MGNPYVYFRLDSPGDLKRSGSHAVRELDWHRDLELIRRFYARFTDAPVDPGEFDQNVGNPCAIITGDGIASFAIPLSFREGETEIGGVATVPDRRNEGLCKALLSEMAFRILMEGKAATLTTERDNLPMQAAARAIGMRQVRPDENGNEGENMADTAVIETERLLLRKYTADDFDALYEILSDPETMRHYPAPFSEDRTRRWIEWNLENYEEYGFGLWAVVLKETGEFIGDCGITIQEIDGEKLPEIGYHIHKKYWRRGYAKEAARAARDWAFRNTRYDALWSWMKYTNEASQATARATGMRKVKEYPDPKNSVSCAWAITRAEWETLKEQEMARMNLKQIFESERISFVEVSEQLIPDYLVMINDIEHVDRFLGGAHDPYTEASEIEWVRENLEKKATVFSMIEKAGGQFIGNIELMDVHDSEGELGIAITAAKQDRGFGTEAISALLAYGFNTLGLKRIFLRVFPGNSRAVRVYEKCGFREYKRTENDIYMETVR